MKCALNSWCFFVVELRAYTHRHWYNSLFGRRSVESVSKRKSDGGIMTMKTRHFLSFCNLKRTHNRIFDCLTVFNKNAFLFFFFFGTQRIAFQTGARMASTVFSLIFCLFASLQQWLHFDIPTGSNVCVITNSSPECEVCLKRLNVQASN